MLVDACRAGSPPPPTRGPSRLCTFKEVSRVLAGFTDGLADEGIGAGPASLRGVELAKREGWTAPGEESAASVDAQPSATADGPGGGLAAGQRTSVDTPANEPDELPGGKDAKDAKDTEGDDK